jgi:deazaflavin-dependent oxidoreductase (nitroreductase family)
MADQQFIDALEESDEVDLTVVGRRSGQESTRPVWFVRAEGKVQLVPIHGTDSSWYRNIEAAPTVRLAAGGREVEATAIPVSEARRVSEIVDAFKAKYGSDTFERLYPKSDAAVEVSLD